jgi:hypothetical protein
VLRDSKEFLMSRSRPTSSRHCFIPQVEALEDRRVPAAFLFPIHLAPGISSIILHLPGVHLPPASFLTTVTFDPGTLPGVTAAELKSLLSAAVVGQTFHETQTVKIKLGFFTVGVTFHETVSNLQVKAVQVPPQVSRTTVTIQADFGVRSRLGGVSGTLLFTVQPLVLAVFTSPGGQLVESAQNLVDAEVLPQNIGLPKVHIGGVPDAITNPGTIKHWLSQQLPTAPIDVTVFLKLYLANGGTLPSSSTGFLHPHPIVRH